jgi:hypothetical protein
MDVKSYAQIYASMRNYIITHQDKLTDFNEGSVLSSYVEAVSRELAMLYIRCRVGFSTYLRGLPYSVFNFKMKEGKKASVNLVFSRSKVFSYETAIPTGTIVQAGDLKFLTSAPGAVPSGETASAPIPAIAEDIGEKYNVGAGEINAIVSTLSADIVAVNNADSASGGIDSEEWGAYLKRFSEYILGLQRTNFYGFLSGLTENNLVRSLQIEEHFPPLNGIWNMTVYLEDGSGGMTEDAINEVKQIIDGDRTIGNGGYRAPGINIRYLTPEIVPVSLQVQVTTERDVTNSIDVSAVAYEVTDAVKEFINGLQIGESVLKSDIIVSLKSISYIEDVKVLGPADNIEITTRQIPRYENCDVTVVVG